MYQEQVSSKKREEVNARSAAFGARKQERGCSSSEMVYVNAYIYSYATYVNVYIVDVTNHLGKAAMNTKSCVISKAI